MKGTLARLRIVPFVVCLVTSASASVSVGKLSYHGWSNCWRVSNGTVELIVVPDIGRIMRYGYIEGPNILWEAPELQGKLTSVTVKDWANYGGDKLWPAPQSAWNWPPDPVLDRGELTVRATADGLILRGEPSGGLVFQRQIHMEPDGTVVRILDRLTNVSSRTVDRSVWQICQVDNPDVAELPLLVTPASPDGWMPLGNMTGVEKLVSKAADGQSMRIQRDVGEARKFGSSSRAGYVASEKGKTRFTMSAAIEGDATYPDGSCPQEVFLNAGAKSYVELELLGPVRHLTPGQSTSMEVKWQLESLAK